MYYIYLIRKQGIPVYVGFTSKTIEERWKSHITESKKQNNQILYKSMLKNGIDCFTIEQLYESEDFQHTLNYMEHHFIWLYKTYYEYGGYNMTLGGEGCIKMVTLSRKEYYQKNKDKINKQSKEYYEQNREKIKEYYEQNREKIKEQKKEYYQKNKNKINKERKEKDKNYRKKNKDKLKEYQKEYYEKYYQKNKDKLNEQRRLKRKLKKSAQDQPMQTLYV